MNRAGVSVVRDRSPAGPAQDGMGGPPFLIRRKPLLHPHSCLVTPQGELLLVLQTFAPTPHLFSSIPQPMLSVLLLLHWGDSWGAKVLLPWWRINATRSQVEGRCDLFSWPPTLGSHQRLLFGEKTARRGPPKIYSWILMCVLIKRHQNSYFSCFVIVLPLNSVVDFVVFNWGGNRGEQGEREEMPSSFCSTLINLLCPVEGRLSVWQYDLPENLNCKFTRKRQIRSPDGLKAALPSGWHWQEGLKFALWVEKAGRGRSSGKSLFIPLHTKARLLEVHVKRFLTGLKEFQFVMYSSCLCFTDILI